MLLKTGLVKLALGAVFKLVQSSYFSVITAIEYGSSYGPRPCAYNRLLEVYIWL